MNTYYAMDTIIVETVAMKKTACGEISVIWTGLETSTPHSMVNLVQVCWAVVCLVSAVLFCFRLTLCCYGNQFCVNPSSLGLKFDASMYSLNSSSRNSVIQTLKGCDIIVIILYSLFG